MAGRHIAFGQMEICPADAADAYAHPHLVRAGLGKRAFDPPERITVHGTGPIHYPGLHVGRHRSKRTAAPSMVEQESMETKEPDTTRASEAV